ncbi:hypothetical protein FIM1_3823 [Kluyveromyces marxianus]|uniref:Uncharacterized protein n=1 Tax=Kluyveromyces marxianus TaxID=4911 RepID=A0ABX6F144_KLUMA|nr:hypothetical protein FIM1_3823 [Kluyveromyces marxianus]
MPSTTTVIIIIIIIIIIATSTTTFFFFKKKKKKSFVFPFSSQFFQNVTFSQVFPGFPATLSSLRHPLVASFLFPALRLLFFSVVVVAVFFFLFLHFLFSVLFGIHYLSTGSPEHWNTRIRTVSRHMAARETGKLQEAHRKVAHETLSSYKM